MKAVYIHIPFCKDICSYCDFSKFFYYKDWISKYLTSLKDEINKYYQNDDIKSIYIGGGTPNSLSLEELEQLFQILTIFKHDKIEYTIECNVELLTIEQLMLFKKYNINRLSIGIQTFNEKFLKFLNRHHKKNEAIEKIKLCQKYFTNINVDLMYALPNQTVDDVKKDLDICLKLNIPHISTYSLMIEPHTKIYNDGYQYINEDLDFSMYEAICQKFKNYNHYEVSNFAKNGYQSIHNLTYWDNEEYYGFGLNASGYINNMRYENTKNLNKYFLGEYRASVHLISKEENIENAFILGFRKINGINKKEFKQKYGVEIKNETVTRLLKEGKLIEDNENIYVKNIYTENDVLINFIRGSKNEK